MMATEKSFPRGGKKPKIAFGDGAKFDFLGNSDKIGKKKKYRPQVRRKQPLEDEDGGPFSDASSDGEENIKASTADKLSAESIQEGMTILGRVMHVGETKVTVSLPGRLIGAAMASHVSRPYTKLLQSYVDDQVEDIAKLDSLFVEGEYVAVRVASLNRNGDRVDMELSMVPQDVNMGVTHTTLREGCIIRGAVESIEDHGYIIDSGIENCKTFLPSNLCESDTKLDIGQVIWCAVKKCQRSNSNNIVTVTNKYDTLKSMRISGSKIQDYTIGDLKPGMALDFHVNKPLRDGCEGLVLTNSLGYVHVSQIEEKLQIAQTKKAHLLYVMPVSKLPFFTTRNIFESAPNLAEEAPLKAGTVFEDAKVSKVTQRAIIFRCDKTNCIMPRKLSKASKASEENVMKLYKPGSVHVVRIIKYHPSDYAYICSDNEETLQRKYFAYGDFKIGDIVEAKVLKISDKGVFVKIDHLNGWIPDIHVSDVGVYKPSKTNSKYTSLIAKKFQIGQNVSARVLKVDPSKALLHLTSKPSLLATDIEMLSRFEDAVIGRQYKGTIVHFLKFGVIVSFFGEARGFVHVREMSSEPIADIQAAFNLGQVVNCTILSVNVPESKINCSFIAPVISDEDTKSKKKSKKRKNDDTENGHLANIPEENGEEPIVEKKKSKKKKLAEERLNGEVEQETEIIEPVKKKKKKSKKEKESSEVDESKLKIDANESENIIDSCNFPSIKNFWELDANTISKNIVKNNNEDSSSDSDTESQEKVKKKKKKLTNAEKVEKARQEEEKLREIERGLTASETQPQSSDQFDRLLLADPNNSELWIAYMAFHLQSTEIERARAIAKKALRTISFREEHEKLNVWLALLNLENRFGTKESLTVTLQEAIQTNDAYEVYSKMLTMYVETSKQKELSALIDTVTSRFKENPEVYVQAGRAAYKLGMVEKARSVMQKAINRLDKKKHIPVIVKFAHMEHDNGDSERAETLFEQIVSCMPQRTDVWCVYVDLMMKSGKIDTARTIFERAIAHKLAPKKMKALYKKWIEMETEHGSEEDVERVRRSAKDYVQKAKSA